MSKQLLFCLLFFIALVSPQSSSSFETGGNEENPFVVAYDDQLPLLGQEETKSFQIIFQIPDRFYLYAEKLDVQIDSALGVSVGPLKKPEPVMKDDPFLGYVVPVYYNEVILELPISLLSSNHLESASIKGDIQFQGCYDKLCYKLMHVPLSVSFKKSPFIQEGIITPIGGEEPFLPSSASFIEKIVHFMSHPDFEGLVHHTFWLALLIAFLGGVLTDLTPCVWPMIPVTLAVVGVRKKENAKHNLWVVAVLVLGMAVMYSGLGVLAALLCKSLGFLFQNITFLVILDVFLLLMGLSLLGLFDIKLPVSIQNKLAHLSTKGFKGTFVVGLTMGLLASPCVGPIVGPILLFVAQTKSVFLGFWLLMSYALGMGLIFFVLGGFYSYLHVRLHGGPWMVWLKRILGVLVIVVSFYYSRSIVSQIRSSSDHASQAYSVQVGLLLAKNQVKPVIVDFFAQWCPPCIKLDHEVWANPQVKETLSKKWVFIKIDCTRETLECREATEKFHVVGWPTVVFFDNNQIEIKKGINEIDIRYS